MLNSRFYREVCENEMLYMWIRND